jgi:hypothetical protein
MGMAIPSSLNGSRGWHARPGKETVSSPLLAQLARSPSKTGRASFQPHGPADKHLNQPDTTTSRTRPREPVHVATTNHNLVDPMNGIRSLTGSYAWYVSVPDRHGDRGQLRKATGSVNS